VESFEPAGRIPATGSPAPPAAPHRPPFTPVNVHRSKYVDLTLPRGRRGSRYYEESSL